MNSNNVYDKLRQDADYIMDEAIRSVLPDSAVKRALKGRNFTGNVILIAIGKAGWQMAKAACDTMGNRIHRGIVITKYGHVQGMLPGCDCYEAGHPIPDENSFLATRKAMEAVEGLTEKDTVLFLISGGGSALFEYPCISGEELQNITGQLLGCGAEITEINTIRKRLSRVKGGRFAKLAAPANIYSIILSDVIGDPLDMIASGPAYPDASTCEEALSIVEKYDLILSKQAKKYLEMETPKELSNVESIITGSVKQLCLATKDACEEQGYKTLVLTDRLCCQAREAGSFLASIVKTNVDRRERLAFVTGGETVVRLTGSGKGGRNQELALAAAEGIAGCPAAVFSVGSDGTDGPTDAAGGYVDGASAERLGDLGINIDQVLKENDSYTALERSGGLILTGPTGTNVNDVAVALIDPLS